jgi:hypothetical protein
MTSLTLFYRRGAPAALLLGLIVGAPDITQAVQLRGGSTPPSGPAPPTSRRAPPTSRPIAGPRRSRPGHPGCPYLSSCPTSRPAPQAGPRRRGSRRPPAPTPGRDLRRGG